MSKRCNITNVKPMVGNNVSHAVNKTKRKFLPNLQNTSFFSEILGKKIKLRVTSKGIKTVEKNGVELTIKEKNTIQTSGRQIQLKRAFNNIIDNSQRYAKKIEIILYTNEKDCVIEFNDNGEGIPRDKYEDVFKPFFTLDPSRNKLKGESGLGLTITRDIIRSHGGDVKLSDSSQGGLQLKVLLPL